jgi:hypothetical protein
MRISWLAAILAALMGGNFAQAQPAKPAEPTVELRLRSITDLLDKAEFVGGLAGQEEIVKGVKGILKNLTKEKTGLEGIDPKRPFGLYANLNLDVINSPVILMVPIADQDRFLTMLKDRLEVVPEKADDGTLKVFVPLVNELYLRFANDYLYVGRTAKELDTTLLINPKTFFGKDEAAIGSLIVRLDRIPDEVKTFILGQFELSVAEQRKKNGAKENTGEKAFLDWLGDGMNGGLNTLLKDSKELNVRVFIDEKADELSAEITLTARTGSTLAKNFSTWGGQSSLSAGIVSAKDAALRATGKASLPADLKKRFAKVVDEMIAEIVKKVDPNARALAQQALDTLAPTFKAAEVDGAIAFSGPNANGKYTLILAEAVKKGKEIEKLLKEVAGFAGAVADFDFDVEKIGDFSLHKITLNEIPPELDAIFGAKTFWLAVSESHLVLSLEPDGTVIRAGLKSKPVTVPVLAFELAVARLLPIIAKDLKEDDRKAIMKDAFGSTGPTGKDTISVTITAGEQITVKAKVKGKAVRVLFGVNQFKDK